LVRNRGMLIQFAGDFGDPDFREIVEKTVNEVV